MRTKIYLGILLSLVTLLGCESLEDTYKDYTGDGTIRYVGSCTDITVKPGWQRLRVNWTNNTDPTIKNIKVTWEANGLRDSVLLPAHTTEFSIDNLADANYEVRVSGVDKDGMTSLTLPMFGRPYTINHEDVLSFSRLVAKHYFVKDRLLLFFSVWDDNIETAELEYYTTEGKQQPLKLTKELLAQQYYLLPTEAILHDEAHPVKLKRTGRLEGCEDLIVFPDYELTNERVYSSDFKLFMKMRYGQFDVTDDFADGLEELEIDYSLNSLEDLLNFPNLKRLYLGKNRFMLQQWLDKMPDYAKNSVLYDIPVSLFVLDKAHELLDLEVERYNQHFLPDDIFPDGRPSYIHPCDNPELPAMEYLDGSGWSIEVDTEEEEGLPSHPEYLLDGNLQTCWQPENALDVRTHKIKIDMGELKTIKGVKVVQKNFDPKNDSNSALLMPQSISLETSVDGRTWDNALLVEEYMIGATSGETTIIHLPSSQNVRYLRFSVRDQIYGKNFTVALAEIGVF